MNSIGERLGYILNKEGISNYKLATDLHIGKSTITNYLNNKTKPDSSKLDAICSYLKIKKQWLLTGEGEIYNETNALVEKKETECDETIKELIEAIKRRDKHVESLIRISEKHADNLTELLKHFKKATDRVNGTNEFSENSEH